MIGWSEAPQEGEGETVEVERVQIAQEYEVVFVRVVLSDRFAEYEPFIFGADLGLLVAKEFGERKSVVSIRLPPSDLRRAVRCHTRSPNYVEIVVGPHQIEWEEAERLTPGAERA